VGERELIVVAMGKLGGRELNVSSGHRPGVRAPGRA
jgi:hypothetical protein